MELIQGYTNVKQQYGSNGQDIVCSEATLFSSRITQHRLESENIFEFQLKWQKNRGLDPEHNPSHSAYLESLCKRLTSGLERRIGDMAAFMSVLDVNRTYQEVLHHGAYCRSQGTSCLVCSAPEGWKE